MTKSVGKEIESLLAKRQWQRARRRIRAELRKNPRHHWLLARLSSTYYEQRQYRRALTIAKRAVALKRQCPLALWDLAGALEAVGRQSEAMMIWKRLLARGTKRLAYGPCGEGLAWAGSLVNDCRYSLACAYREQGAVKLAERYLDEHIRHRRRGVRSIYALREVLVQARRRTARKLLADRS